MNNKDLILAIDNGTQSLKTRLFNLGGKLTRISHESVRLRNKAFQPEDVVFYFEVLNNAVPVSLRLAFGEEF